MRFVGSFARRIADEQKAVRKPRDHQIVENAAGFVGEESVTLPADRKPQHIHGNEALQCASGLVHVAALCAQDDLAHMRHVEQTRRRARVQMLLQYAHGILNGHFITGEADHARAERAMQVVKRRSSQRIG